jgi:hypothetical protein
MIEAQPPTARSPQEPNGGFWWSSQQAQRFVRWVGVCRAFAGSVVELVGDGVELGHGDGGEVGASGEVLAQQA